MTIRHSDKRGITYSYARVNTGANTIYVRTTGNDSNEGTSSSPVLTLQEAVNRIPEFVSSDVIIDIGAGTFSNFTLGGRDLTGVTTGIEFRGVLQTATLATGNPTGTSTSGNFVTLTDTSQNWTPGDLVGRIVNHDTWANDVIISNTSTSLTVACPSWYTMNGKAYTIKDHATVISPASGGTVTINGCSGGSIVRLQDIRVLSGAGKNGVDVKHCTTPVMLDRVRVEASDTIGVNAAGCVTVGLNNCYIKDPKNYGFYAAQCQTAWASATFIYCTVATTGSAVFLRNVPDAWLDGTFQGSTYHGVESSNSIILAGTVTVQGNTRNGVHLENSVLWRGPSDTSAAGVIAGTGNGRFGVNIRSNCLIKVAGVPTATGTLGNYSFNDSFARTWATDFASNGDIMICDDTLSRVERVD